MKIKNRHGTRIVETTSLHSQVYKDVIQQIKSLRVLE